MVTDDKGASSPSDTVTISANTPPIASAGNDQLVGIEKVTLNGSKSRDDDGTIQSYSWVFKAKPTGSTATLSDSTVVSPTFDADLEGTYTLELTVTDDLGAMGTDTVDIVVTIQVLTWEGGGDGISWNDANNWNPNAVPSSASQVQIPVDNTSTINISGVIDPVDSLELSGGTLEFSNGAAITINDLELNGGNLGNSSCNGSSENKHN